MTHSDQHIKTLFESIQALLSAHDHQVSLMSAESVLKLAAQAVRLQEHVENQARHFRNENRHADHQL